ncbi:antitoxin Xre/MbcA/ParS toxin-binding domain-containing protein [Vibrio alfacsensis]|uniref:antitoxin Xre/MbcA/ParS toxin-binding domain-containing protein n=1 Tax=Vibrio TaxID=662 RepID=UPI0040687823
MANMVPSKDNDIRTLAFDVFGSNSLVEEWFQTPIPALSGRKPIDLLDDVNGYEQVRLLLNRLKCGEFS